MKKLIFSILVLQICFLNGCKKYPDGPLISFYSATNRITGIWYFKHFLANNVDMIKTFSCDTCKCNWVSFTSDEEGTFLSTTRECYFDFFGRWNLTKNEKNICFGIEYGANNFSLGPWLEKGQTICWRIRRLTQHDFWITCDYQGIHYEINWHK